jgi:HSP20 family protein
MGPVREYVQHDFTDSTWFSQNEGQLSVDVMETPREIIVRSAIAGVNADDLDITLHEDALTIRGNRAHELSETKRGKWHVQECHWGAFSRSIILPTHVDPNSVEAILKKGVLTIRLKKIETDHPISILDLDDL